MSIASEEANNLYSKPDERTVGSANTIPDYQQRQEALKQASRYALRKAINNVLKGRES